MVKKKQKNHFSRREITGLDKNLKASFDKIKEEFEEHLDAINENTNDIH